MAKEKEVGSRLTPGVTITQIVVAPGWQESDGEMHYTRLFALCSDNTIWSTSGPSVTGDTWEQVSGP